jgi:deazaflavin-dependent oxidoreductase (nitroreductase family)
VVASYRGRVIEEIGESNDGRVRATSPPKRGGRRRDVVTKADSIDCRYYHFETSRPRGSQAGVQWIAEIRGVNHMSEANDWNLKVIEEFRANEGKVGGQFEGVPVLLLHTNGAKSGLERVNPMMYLKESGRVFVFASKAGADTDPDWYRNLEANSGVTVEIGADTFAATAEPIVGTERDRIYAVQADLNPGFAEYQMKTTRVIPVVELIRA